MKEKERQRKKDKERKIKDEELYMTLFTKRPTPYFFYLNAGA